MTSTAISAQGTQLFVSNQDFTFGDGHTISVANAKEVKNLKSFKGFDGQATEVDVTNLSSSAKEYRLGLQDFGNLVFDVDRDFADAGQGELDLAKRSSSMRYFLMVFPNSKAAKFAGFVKNSPLEGGVDQVIKSTGVTIRITGSVDIVEFKKDEKSK